MRILWLQNGEIYQGRDFIQYHMVFEAGPSRDRVLIVKNRLTAKTGWVTREEAEGLTLLATREVN